LYSRLSLFSELERQAEEAERLAAEAEQAAMDVLEEERRMASQRGGPTNVTFLLPLPIPFLLPLP